jgi:hypothetical protein
MMIALVNILMNLAALCWCVLNGDKWHMAIQKNVSPLKPVSTTRCGIVEKKKAPVDHLRPEWEKPPPFQILGSRVSRGFLAKTKETLARGGQDQEFLYNDKLLWLVIPN